jgi:hypothetical protein
MGSEVKAAISTIVFLAAMILPWVYKLAPLAFKLTLMIAAAIGVLLLIAFLITAIYAVFLDLYTEPNS